MNKVFLNIEVPSHSNNNELKVMPVPYDSEKDKPLFHVLYDLVGNGCSSLDAVKTSKGLLLVDDVGLYNDDLSVSRFAVGERQIVLHGNIIVCAGVSESGETLLFDYDFDNPELVNYPDILWWFTTLSQYTEFFNKGCGEKNATQH